MDSISIPSPCYVVEKQRFVENLKKIKSFQDKAGVEVICALKANANFFLFPYIQKHFPHATASSVHEARLVFEEFGTKAHACVPVVKEQDVHLYNRFCSHLTFNSLSQFEDYNEALLDEISIGLRVNPGYSEVDVDMYNPALPHSRLGVRKEELETLPLKVKGLHFHALCENDASSLEKVLIAFEKGFKHLFSQLEWVNLGGGHLITEKEYDVQYAVKVISEFKQRYPHLRVIMEPGSAFTWQTGFLKAKVEDVIQRDDFDIAMLDVSFTAHMPDCLEMPYQPTVKRKLDKLKKRETILGGNTCLAGDYIRGYYFENPVKKGDTIIFQDMIHYTMVKTSKFNGVEHPSIGMINLDGEFELFRSFHYQDFKSLMG